MSLSIGIIGLPNVGKSTLFNALVKNAQAEVKNFPFTTIEPNVGIVSVPDERLRHLAEIEHSQKVIPTTIKFVDIAGLIKGAHKGEGLGNQFLSHIREVDAICLVLRAFEDKDTVHVEGSLDPNRDAQTIITELALADLQMISSIKERLQSDAKKNGKDGDEAKLVLRIIDRVSPALDKGQLVKIDDFDKNECKLIKKYLPLLTIKPILVALNVGEGQAGEHPLDLSQKYNLDKFLPEKTSFITICAKSEAELIDLPESEQADYLNLMGLKESGLKKLAREAYKLLGLVTFFTAGEKEARAWTIRFGAKAAAAAGVIHTDFAQKFIKAEVVAYDDFVKHEGWRGSAAAGKLRLEGKEYVVRDGDVIFFRHG